MALEVAAELGKVAVAKLAEVKAEDAVRVVRAFKAGPLGAALLVPGVGSFALGLAVGAGLGVLLAPRSGRETRGALARAFKGRFASLRRALPR